MDVRACTPERREARAATAGYHAGSPGLIRVSAMLLMIDNYDSFTFNLVQYLGELGQEVKVVRNDALDVAGIRALNPSHIMISPGPGTPDDAGVSLDLLRELSGEMHSFAVWLGHDEVGQAGGGRGIRAISIKNG
jgi:anthranilate synthase component 2